MTGSVGNHRHLQIANGAFATVGDKTISLVATNAQINLHSYSLFNAGTLACDTGLGISFSPTAWKFYTYNGTAATDVTTAIQAGTTTNLFTTTTNSGFLIENKAPFGFVFLTLSQAQSGSPVYVYQYWNGTAWTTLNMTNTPSYGSTGSTYLVFNPPIDWAAGDGGLGINTGYSILVKSSTAGGQSVQATASRVNRWVAYNGATGSKNRFQVTFDNQPYLMEGGEFLAPYFGTAANLNTFEASFQVNP